MKKYEWAVIGSGISGMVTAEILTRQGHSTILIEKNDMLASETTREFHEWIHTGALYSLIPDNLLTLKYLLGAIDDLLEYYSSFRGMNLIPTESGLEIQPTANSWFQDNHIHFKYRIAGRKVVIPWIAGVARSIYLIDRIKEHDWLRRRAGVVDPFKLRYSEFWKIFKKLLAHEHPFFDYETPDFTTNSRNLLKELIGMALHNGLDISTSNKFIGFERQGKRIEIKCKKESYGVENIVLCINSEISKYIQTCIKTTYAPIAVVNNVPSEQSSYVELDYYPKNCINIITKENQIALIGGISFSEKNRCEDYIETVIAKHKKYNPRINVLCKYIGIKNEITVKDQPRNYLYHILNISDKVWSIIPGKFTLGFSIAPEFYRQVYKKNPKKIISIPDSFKDLNAILSNTVWQDAYNNFKPGGLSDGHN